MIKISLPKKQDDADAPNFCRLPRLLVDGQTMEKKQMAAIVASRTKLLCEDDGRRISLLHQGYVSFFVCLYLSISVSVSRPH